jgi:hypothetical protein
LPQNHLSAKSWVPDRYPSLDLISNGFEQILLGLPEGFDKGAANKLTDRHPGFLGSGIQGLLQGGFHLNYKSFRFHMDTIAEYWPYHNMYVNITSIIRLSFA